MDGCGRLDLAVGPPGAARAGLGYALAPPAGVLAGWVPGAGSAAHLERRAQDCERDGGALSLSSVSGIRHGGGGSGVALPEPAPGVGHAGGAVAALYRTHLGAQRGLARQPHAGAGRRRNRAAQRAPARPAGEGLVRPELKREPRSCDCRTGDGVETRARPATRRILRVDSGPAGHLLRGESETRAGVRTEEHTSEL